MVDEIKRALEIAELVPFKYLIQHLGVTGEEYDERKLDAAFSSLEEIRLFAKQRGVEVLIENTPNGLATPEKLLMFFEMTHMDLQVCFDVGHANMNDGVETAFRLLKSRIRSTHIHDNDGKEDLHLFPFANGTVGGTIDWRKTMEMLRTAPGQYPLLLELRDAPDLGQPLEVVKSVFDKLEGLRSSNES
jgi:sugar phosphate isomerase/epimerase